MHNNLLFVILRLSALDHLHVKIIRGKALKSDLDLNLIQV